MRKFTDIILQFLTVLAGLFLLLAYLSVYIKPTVFWFLGIVGLSYPILLLFNLAFLIYWVIRWKWHFLYPVLAILIGISHFSNFFQFPFGKDLDPKDDDIKIMSYNVNLFQLYSWAKSPPTYNSIYNFIKDEDPSIVCLQEFYVNNKFTEKMAKKALDKNVHIGYISKEKGSGYGIATYTQYPIVETGELKFENSANACIYTDVIIKNDTIRVYNSHLQSIRLRERNMNFILDPNFRKDSHKINEIKDIFSRFRDALRKRALQVEIVRNHILESPYPVLVCGDFNESPISYNYRIMRQILNDAFVDAGVGVGHTYKGFFPSFRIDYILYDFKFTATSYYSPRVYHSDHYPVVATVKRKPQE
jgi:endonuclease/exonuclease/phosphatase family metal-dependent hydrolase